MSGRWTIKAFDTSVSNKKETPTMEEVINSDESDELSMRKFYMKCKNLSVLGEYEKFIYNSEDTTRSQAEQERAKAYARKIVQRFIVPKI